MAHISNIPNCFWVLRFPLSSSIFLSKNLSPRERLSSSSIPFLSLRSFLFSRRSTQIFALAVPNRSVFSLYRNRQISSIFSSFRRISSVPGQIQVCRLNFCSDLSFLDFFFVGEISDLVFVFDFDGG